MNFRRDNHYVPSQYLKNWESSAGRIWVYRILVTHENVPLWKDKSARGIAYHKHLYTRLAIGLESDEIERWFDSEYETPAANILQKVISNGRLTPSDWRILIRFLALQDVRTPARLVERLKSWHETLPELMQSTLENSVKKLESMSSKDIHTAEPKSPLTEYIPFHVETEKISGQEFRIIKAETIVGRGLWLYSIKHLLTKTADILHQHKWTILCPPNGLKWFTSDDPVIRLNYYGPNKYDFSGGWGSKGTEIFMPLSPDHILYTQIGSRPPKRGTKFSFEKAKLIRKFIAEHAHRFIFSKEPDNTVPSLKPRVADKNWFKDEENQWANWNKQQTDAERKIMGWKEG